MPQLLIINQYIKHEKDLSEKELLMLSLLCFMDTKKDMENAILDSAKTITNIPGLNKNIAQFTKGVVLMLCDKFVEDELLNTQIANLVGGNMKIVEDYAQRVADKVAKEKVDKTKEEFVINLDKKGFTVETIAETAGVSLEFVKNVLAKQ